jgi:hypothetical protein
MHGLIIRLLKGANSDFEKGMLAIVRVSITLGLRRARL